MTELVDYLKLGKKAVSEENYEEAIRMLNKALPKAEPSQQMDIHRSLGDIYGKISQAKQAIVHFTNALKIATQLNDLKIEVKLLQQMGLVCQEAKSYEEAIKCNEKCLEKLKNLDKGKNPDLSTEADVTRCLGSLYSITKNHMKALSTLQRALQLQRKVGDRRGEAMALYELGLEQADTDDIEEAVRNLKEALSIFKDLGIDSESRKVQRELMVIQSELDEEDWIEKKASKFKKFRNL